MLSDADLLDRMQAGDTASAEALYDRHGQRLYAVAMHILGHSDQACAVIEDVFALLASPPHRREARPCSVGAWLVRLTRDQALARRVSAKPQGRNDPAAVDPTEAGSPAPRKLVERAFFGGLGVAELARSYSLSEDEARRLLRTGMAELKAQFEPG